MSLQDEVLAIYRDEIAQLRRELESAKAMTDTWRIRAEAHRQSVEAERKRADLNERAWKIHDSRTCVGGDKEITCLNADYFRKLVQESNKE